MPDPFRGGDPEVMVTESVEGRVVLEHSRGRIAFTQGEARTLHRWLGQMLWAQDDAGRAIRIGAAGDRMVGEGDD